MTNKSKNYLLSASKDKMEAHINLKRPGIELEDCDIKEIINDIEVQGIKPKETFEQLYETIKNCTSIDNILIATGKPAIDGQDGYVEFITEEKGETKPVILEDGTVDYYNLELVKNVNKNDVLAIVHPPKDGVDGLDAFGQVVKFKPGKSVKAPLGKNVEYLAEKKEIVAIIAGQVSVSNNKINVFEFLEVKNVDFKTGNIDFVGSVVINDAITNGFTVKAAGDITVNGYVDSAFITCGGNLTVKGGIQGRNKGRVIAGGNVVARYIENCEVQACGSIIVRDSIMHSKVYANEKVLVSEGKGLLVGGVVSAEKEIVANTIGSHLATTTELEVGVNPTLREELQKITKELTKENDELKKARQAQRLLKAKEKELGSLPPKHVGMLLRLNITVNHLAKRIDEQTQLQQQMLEKLLASSEGRIKANKNVFSGVKVTIGTRYRNVTDTLKSPSFSIGTDGEITIH